MTTESDSGQPADGDEEEAEEIDVEHVADVDPGAGCTEIWEHLSAYREHDEE